MVPIAFVMIVVAITAVFVIRLADRGDDNIDMSGPFGHKENKATRKVPYGVATDNEKATRIGMDILNNGGNAVDAAIAVSYAIGVTDFYASGLGSGGFMVVHFPGQEPVLYDYQVTAPKKSNGSGKNMGVPGLVAGMEQAHHDFGQLRMRDLIQPSIELAEEGTEITDIIHNRLKYAAPRLDVQQLPHLYPNGRPIASGEILKQEQLAETLRKIQREGSNAFYRGDIAEQIDRAVDSIELQDLESYESLRKEPVKGHFAGFDVYAASPPGGGIMFIQSLQLAEYYNVENTKDDLPGFMQLMNEINRETHEEKIRTIGDPDFVNVPVEELLSDKHTQKLAKNIPLETSSKDSSLSEVTYGAALEDDGNTTHFVVVDQNGMMVSATNTLSNFFGSGKLVAGFFMNDELRTFSHNVNSPNRREAGKRPFSYMAPAILSKDGVPIIGIGSAGGNRIPSAMSQVLVHMLKFDEPPQKAVDEARFFMVGGSDSVTFERELPNLERTLMELQKRGYDIDWSRADSETYFGSVQTMVVDYKNNQIVGGSDLRRDGTWESK